MKSKTTLITAIAAVFSLIAIAALPVLAAGPGYGMGYGMDQGMGQGMSQGMGQGMHPMGYGRGMNPGCPFNAASIDRQFTTDDVKKIIEGNLVWSGGKNLKVGEIKEKDEKTIAATIVTKDGSLVRTLEFDRATGFHTPIN